MYRFLARRLAASILVLVGVSFSVFLMLYLLPGDPIDIMLTQSQTQVSPEELAALRRHYGLDQPFAIRYGRYVWNALHGDFGTSLYFERPAIEVLRQQLPATLSLALAAMAIGVVFGLAMGILAAVNRNSWLDQLSMVLALGGVSIPGFWLGLMLIIIFAVTLHLLPAQGSGGLARLILPAVALGFEASAVIARITRSSMLEVFQSEYILTARGKCLSECVVILRHALRNAFIPIVTILGLQFGHLLGGAVVIEKVFARQGIGALAVDSIFAKDFIMVQTVVLVVSVVYTALSLVVDMLYAVLDPRIRVASQ